jgi:hypothetical protein
MNGGLTSSTQTPNERTHRDRSAGRDGLGQKGPGDGQDDVGDVETRQGEGILVIAVVQGFLLKTLKTGVSQVSSIEISGEVQEEGEREDDRVCAN